MKSLKNILCGLGLLSLIAAPTFANEPTADAPSDAAATHEAHTTKTEKTTKTVAKKAGKKAKKSTTEEHKTDTTTEAPAGEAHPAGN